MSCNPVKAALILALVLPSCAPTATRTAVTGTPTTLDPATLAEACAGQPRVDSEGVLLWGDTGPGEEVRLPAPYDIRCPDRTFRNLDGMVVTVQSPSVTQSLGHFPPDSYLLAYYADLRVRFPAPGVIEVDDPRTLPEALQGDIQDIEIVVIPAGGAAQVLLRGLTRSSVTLPPTQAFTVTIRTGRHPNPWPQVFIDPTSGTVRANLSP